MRVTGGHWLQTAILLTMAALGSGSETLGAQILTPASFPIAPEFDPAYRVKIGPQGAMSHTLAVADVDGNGLGDIAIANWNDGAAPHTQSEKARLYWGDGNGDYAHYVNLAGPAEALPASHVFKYAFADLDGDQQPDLIANNGKTASNAGIVFYPNLGNGLSATPVVLGAPNTTGFTVGDIDGDSDTDIFYWGATSADRGMFVNDGSGNFTAGDFCATQYRVSALAFGDIDGDGDMDGAAMCSLTSGGTLAPCLLFNDGTGRFGAPISIHSENGHWCALADMNCDGICDFVATRLNTGAQASQYFIAGNGGVFQAGVVPIGAPSYHGQACVADIDLDGNADLVSSHNATFGMRLYLNHGDGTFADYISLDTGPVWVATAPVVADLDGNSRPDIVKAGNLYNGASSQQCYALINGPFSPSVAIRSAVLPPAQEGIAYQHQIDASHGVAPYSWSIRNQPSWLSVNATTGMLSGTPSPGSGATTCSFILSLIDANGARQNQPMSLSINSPVGQTFFDDVETGNLDYTVRTGSFARARALSGAAHGGQFGIALDATSSVGYSYDANTGGGVSQAIADDPAQWGTGDVANWEGELRREILLAGRSSLRVGFDYRITGASGLLYRNLAFEWSDDGGASWHVASGPGSGGAGIYRNLTSGTFKRANFVIDGWNTAASSITIRWHWLVALTYDATGTNGGICLDNLLIGDIWSGGAPASVPFTEDFEAATPAVGVQSGWLAQANLTADAAASGSHGLQLDCISGLTNWPLQEIGGPGQAAADDISQWETIAPDHVNIVEWAVNAANLQSLDLNFDYKIVNDTSTSWYANFVIEWSGDLGVTWNVAAGSSATTSGIYRAATSGFVAESIAISGFPATQPVVAFRLRSLTKWSKDDIAGLATWIAIDNIDVSGQGIQPAPPSISSVTPNSGSMAGGDAVVITGMNFGTLISVTIGGIACPLGACTDTRIEVSQTPSAMAPGSVDIVVINTAGLQAVLGDGFTYIDVSLPPSITSIAPAQGDMAGGTRVTIFGTNLGATSNVMFGNQLGTSIAIVSPAEITVTTPASAAPGAVDVVVAAHAQTARLTQAFTYTAAQPVIPATPAAALAAGGGMCAVSKGGPLPAALLALALALCALGAVARRKRA